MKKERRKEKKKLIWKLKVEDDKTANSEDERRKNLTKGGRRANSEDDFGKGIGSRLKEEVQLQRSLRQMMVKELEVDLKEEVLPQRNLRQMT